MDSIAALQEQLPSLSLALLIAQPIFSASQSFATNATTFGFRIAHFFSTPVANIVDLFLVGSASNGPASSSLHLLLQSAHTLALLGIDVGHAIPKLALQTSVDILSDLGGEIMEAQAESLRLLTLFAALVKREYSTSLETDPYPDKGLGRWSILEVLTALATWTALQSVTAEEWGRKIAGELEEVDAKSWRAETEQEKAEEQVGEVIWEVDEKDLEDLEQEVVSGVVEANVDIQNVEENEGARTRAQLRRFSKLALGSYGGVGIVAFGVKLPQPSTETPTTEPSTSSPTVEETFTSSGAMNTPVDSSSPASPSSLSTPFNFWNLVRGSHDHDIIELLGDLPAGSIPINSTKRPFSSRSKAQPVNRGPKSFVITDHSSQSVLLLLRGTLSLDDIATDLTCEAASFEASNYWDDEELLLDASGGSTYQVHGGMQDVASAMGSRNGAVTKSVRRALRANEGYALYVLGHSLGAGVAALLTIHWANPSTCLTTGRSGLPPGRVVKCFGFAPPCTMDARLSARCKLLHHSLVCSNDAVSRFSLGHIQDIRSVVAWLCYGGTENSEESCKSILRRIVDYRRGSLDDDMEAKMDEEAWFVALRGTLEANMQYANLFPPGEIWWLVEKDDLVLPADVKGTVLGPRLFKVTGSAEVVFRQMLFTPNMISSHGPHKYAQAIHDFM